MSVELLLDDVHDDVDDEMDALKTQTSIFNIWRFFPQYILRVQILEIFGKKKFEDFQKY